jgi:hypothetical protein
MKRRPCSYHIAGYGALSTKHALFYGEMNWDNQGAVWHVDHVYPVSSAEDKDHLIGLMHYLNLQPLFAADNSSKCDMMPEDWVM